MHWFDWEGLIMDLLLLAPNLVFTCRNRDGFVNLYHNKAVECLEQIGRFGCFLFLFLTPPVICRGVWFPHGTAVRRTPFFRRSERVVVSAPTRRTAGAAEWLGLF